MDEWRRDFLLSVCLSVEAGGGCAAAEGGGGEDDDDGEGTGEGVDGREESLGGSRCLFTSGVLAATGAAPWQPTTHHGSSLTAEDGTAKHTRSGGRQSSGWSSAAVRKCRNPPPPQDGAVYNRIKGVFQLSSDTTGLFL